MMNNIALYFLQHTHTPDWVVGYQGPIKRPTGTSRAVHFIVIFVKTN